METIGRPEHPSPTSTCVGPRLFPRGREEATQRSVSMPDMTSVEAMV